MKKILNILLIISMLSMSFSVFAKAYIGGSTSTPPEGVQNRQLQREQMMQEFQNTKGEIQGEMKQLRNQFQEQKEIFASSTPEEKREMLREMKEQRTSLQNQVKDLTKSLRGKGEELRNNFREKFQSIEKRAKIALAHQRGLQMSNVFGALTNRFDRIIERVEGYITTLEEEGKDTSALLTAIEEIKDLKVEIESDIVQLKADYEALLDGDSNIQEIKEEAKEIAQTIKEKYKSLKDKLRELITLAKSL